MCTLDTQIEVIQLYLTTYLERHPKHHQVDLTALAPVSMRLRDFHEVYVRFVSPGRVQILWAFLVEMVELQKHKHNPYIYDFLPFLDLSRCFLRDLWIFQNNLVILSLKTWSLVCFVFYSYSLCLKFCTLA